MPNTLAHLGINGLATKTLMRKADLLVIYVGSVIPDFPWILQRLVSTLQLSINNYDLRLYSIALSSLFFSLILSFALANLFKNVTRTFIIFSFGSLVHLLLDSFETKWGNGVHFFAPFSWELFNLELFWPEDILIYILTAFGFIYILLNWRDTIAFLPALAKIDIKKMLLLLISLLAYLLLPFLFVKNVESADNHFIKTLRNSDYRLGKYFETDRGFYVDSPNQDKYITPFKEDLKISNLDLNSSEMMSVRAKFISKDEIKIIEYHIHHNRDIFSYVGLIFLFILLIVLLVKTISNKIF